jgi:membrane associated rhomboid family serine protease
MRRPLDLTNIRGAVRWIIVTSFLMLIAQISYPPLAGILGLVPARVLNDFWLWQPVTYAFLHGGFLHWLFNMLVLWMFGQDLEDRWGTAYFLRYFFTCSIGAALCVIALSPHSNMPTIGASGGVFGILVGFAVVFPDAVMLFMFLFPMKVWQAVVLFGLIELFAGIEGRSGISRFAHLGGMATGYLVLKARERVGLRRWHPFEGAGDWLKRHNPMRRKPRVEMRELTDDLVKEVDRILDKVLKNGVESLSPKEKEIMDRYSRMKH